MRSGENTSTLDGKRILYWLQTVLNALVIAALLAAFPWVISIEKMKDVVAETSKRTVATSDRLHRALEGGQLKVAKARIDALETRGEELREDIKEIKDNQHSLELAVKGLETSVSAQAKLMQTEFNAIRRIMEAQ